jgi:hypothetical protein
MANRGVQEFRSSGVQEFRSSGVQEFRSSGVQVFRCSGVQVGRTFKIARIKSSNEPGNESSPAGSTRQWAPASRDF